jgi:hypothetical protein
MKSTTERLEQSYCRPTTEAEWADIISANPNLPDRPSRFVELNYDLAYIVDGSVLIFGRLDYHKPKMALRKEIKIHQHVDLMHDHIVPWRLIEDGWTPFEHATAGTAYEYRCNEDALLTFVRLGDDLPEFHTWPTDIDGETGNLSVPYYGIKTYTDLLNLIRLIG